MKTQNKQKLLIIAPRHYVDELTANYTNDKFSLHYFHEENIRPTNLHKQVRTWLNTYDLFIGLADYSSLLAAYLNQQKRNPCPDPILLAKLQDKLISRNIQKQLGLFHGEANSFSRLSKSGEITFPLFLKPRRASMSYLATRVDDEEGMNQIARSDYATKLTALNKRWDYLYKLLNAPYYLKLGITDLACESLCSGSLQVTLDGYIQQKKVKFFGFTKSVFMNNHVSFKRFDYPHHLPKKVARKIRRHAKKLIKDSGFNNSLFNIEYKVGNSGEYTLIEVNTRPSSQFMYPIEVVTGVNPLDVAINIVAGKRVRYRQRKQRYKMCSVCVFRVDRDEVVTHIPSNDEVLKDTGEYQVMRWKPFALPGERLSDHPNDSHTFRYAEVVVAHTNHVKVHEYEDIIRSNMLEGFKFKKR